MKKKKKPSSIRLPKTPEMPHKIYREKVFRLNSGPRCYTPFGLHSTLARFGQGEFKLKCLTKKISNK